VEAASIPWRPIGELFVEKGSITPDQLEEALAEQAATGLRLGEVLVKRNLISSPELTQALMEQLGREVAREEGFGTGLWSAIRSRNASHNSEADPVPLEADRPPFGAGLTRKLGVVPDEPDAPAPSDSAMIEEAGFEQLREVLVQSADEKADQAEADILRESLTEAHVEIKALRQGVAEREERLEALATEIATLREAAESQDYTVGATALEQELSTVRAEVDELTISLAGANGKASELESTLTAERQAHGETRQRLDEATRAEENARQARVEIERDFGAMQAERDAARSEASASHDALGGRENELAALRDQIAAAETALDAERDAHADTRRHAEQTAADAAQVRQVVDGFDQERCELAERARTLEEDLVTRQATESRLVEQLEAAQRRTAELDDQVSSLAAQLEEIEQERLALIDRARTLEEDLASREANGSHLEEQLHAAEGRAAELNDQVVSLAGGLASAESALEEAEAAREAARRDADTAADKLNDAEARITELHATVDGFEGEKAELSKAFSDQRLALERELGTVGARLAEESAAHSETRCVLSHALTELAAREPIPILGDESEPGPQDYLCFIPKKDGYRLVGRTGLLPAAGDECDVDGVAHAVTRVARSPLPFDSRTCVYLIAAG